MADRSPTPTSRGTKIAIGVVIVAALAVAAYFALYGGGGGGSSGGGGGGYLVLALSIDRASAWWRRLRTLVVHALV